MRAATTWEPLHPSLWPSESQRKLLRALLLTGDAATASWRDWCAEHDLDRADASDRALFPSLFLEADRLAVEPAGRVILRAAYMATWAHNRTVLSLFPQTLRRFNDAGLQVAVLKGLPLLLYYYEDIGARPMADVDVLIRPGDLQLAAQLLQANGWTPEKAIPPPRVAAHLHALSWRHDLGFYLDLHWRPFTIDCPTSAEERFWARTELREWAGSEISVPAATDFLIMMCFHGRRQDQLAKGRWVLDVARVLAGAGVALDWQEVVDQSIATGLAPVVRDALDYMRNAHGLAVPEDHLARLARAGDDERARQRYREVVQGDAPGRDMRETVASKWWRYSSVQMAHRRQPTTLGFLSYYVADRQWEWGLDHAWQVAPRALVMALVRLRAHGI